MKNIIEFQQRIGYQFTTPSLLRQALTHSSYANEHHMAKGSDNERLEFLGDAVLELTSSEFIYKLHPEWPEGKLTKLRASLVCEQALAFCCRQIDLGDYLYLGKGEDQTGGRQRKSVLSDAFEAVIGAIYLDGGFANAKEFVENYVLNDIDSKQLFYDSKTILQEIIQGDSLGELSYVLVDESGPDHNKQYTLEARIDGKAFGRGTGANKKSAEQEAAYQAILTLKNRR